jgi:hypothetical protein
VHVVIQCLLNHFLRRLEKGPNIDIKTRIGKPCRNDAGTPVVTILTQLGNKNTRPSSELIGKGLNILAQPLKSLVLLICFPVHA